jgi:general stress protein 26
VSRAKDERDGVEVNRLLAGAAKTVASARYCWLATTAENGGVNARPMGRLLSDPDESDWTIRFITDGRSRKASDIRRVRKVAVIFQDDPDDAFVTLIGAATLRESASEVRRRWKNAYNVYFPGERDPKIFSQRSSPAAHTDRGRTARTTTKQRFGHRRNRHALILN